MRKLFVIGLVLLASMAAFGAQPKTVTIRSLKVLAVIYRGAADDKGRMSDQNVQGTRNGIELGRLYYFRNTQCRLNLDMTYLVVEQSAPKNDGPTYDYIVEDLKGRGVKDNQYDGIFCTGVGFTGNWGGFGVFGKTGAAFGGTGKGSPIATYPAKDPNTWYDTGWCFIHEFQHALDGPICGGTGHVEMLSDHPYSDSSESYFWWGHHAGMHWDWVAHCLSSFKSYMGVTGATNSKITFKDADGDGFPDNDPRLAMDEKRFGSDAKKKDTDADGLNDLREFSADNYRGSNPRKADTDGDGIPDGKDPNPTVAIAQAVSYSDKEPAIDGTLDSAYKPFTMGTYIDNSPELAAARISACWNEDALYLFVKSKKQLTLDMMIDTSAKNGFWEGGDTYLIQAKPDGKVVFSGLGLDGPVPGAKAAWGTDGLEIMIPAVIGQGVSNEINFGGKRRSQDVVDGMILLANQPVSFNLILSAGTERATITPNYSMFDTKLVKPAAAPSRPSLRFTKTLTTSAIPTVSVSGVSAKDTVAIIDASGKTVGRGVGSGDITLTGTINVGSDATTGANVLRAKVGNRESKPITLVVDNKAMPPTVEKSADGKTLSIKGEPGASVDILMTMAPTNTSTNTTRTRSGRPRPVGTVVLDKNGAGSFDLANLAKGYLGAYGLGTESTRPMFWRTDKEIKFDYNDGTADPRLPNDGFCVRWSGVLDVPADGEYTFYLATDDGGRLSVDNDQVIDNWGHHDVAEKTAQVTLTKGEHRIRVSYYEESGWAAAHLDWSGPGIERTSALPVSPIAAAQKDGAISARQTDAAGNTSDLPSGR